MHLPLAFRYAVLVVFHHALLAAGADVAYIQASIANMTADISSIKATAQSINTNVDYPLYLAGMGNYKTLENKFNALTTRTNTWNVQIQGSTVSTAADIEAIVTSFQTLAIELIATLAGIVDKAGLFATTPVVGQNIANSIAGFQGAFGLYAVIIRATNTQVDNRIIGSIAAIYILFPIATDKYKGVLC